MTIRNRTNKPKKPSVLQRVKTSIQSRIDDAKQAVNQRKQDLIDGKKQPSYISNQIKLLLVFLIILGLFAGLMVLL